MIYESDRSFQIWAYTVSHSFLLLRSPMILEDVDGYSFSMNHNIDIEFSGVGYVDLPDMMHGVWIEEIIQDIPAKFNRYSASLGYKVFEIKSAEHSFYIVAGGCRVGKNNWVTEDRVSNFMLKYDEILASSL
jgi:hypothetical protein